MASSTVREQAVREYLEMIEAGVRVGRARSLAARAKDPLVKLRALTVIGNAERLEAGFIEHAAAFADAEGVPVDVWRQLGVPDDVLVRAGLSKRPVGAAKKPATKAAPRKKKPSKRLEALDLDAVAAKLPRKAFKVRDLAERIDRPAPTTRNYLDRLVAAGTVNIVGEDATGRGKPAKIYQRA